MRSVTISKIYCILFTKNVSICPSKQCECPIRMSFTLCKSSLIRVSSLQRVSNDFVQHEQVLVLIANVKSLIYMTVHYLAGLYASNNGSGESVHMRRLA